MRLILHIKSDTADERADAIIRTQQGTADHKVEVVDLRGEVPNYDALLDRVFAADAVAVW